MYKDFLAHTWNPNQNRKKHVNSGLMDLENQIQIQNRKHSSYSAVCCVIIIMIIATHDMQHAMCLGRVRNLFFDQMMQILVTQRR